MAKHRVCFRLPTFVVQLSFEAAERDISYEEIAASINKEKVAELLCLDALGYGVEDEVKSSVEDFKSPNGHNFIADYNYYVMPADVFDAVKDAVPYGVGVLCPDGEQLRCVRKATRKDRTRPVSEMLLMLWRSSRREIIAGREKHE